MLRIRGPRMAWRALLGVRTRWPPPAGLRHTATTAASTPTPASTTSGSASSSTAPALPPQPAVLLRDYQEECIQSVLACLARGQRRLGISLATGAGKTVIFTQLLGRVAAPAPGADRTLILAHRRELVEQAARHCTRAYPDQTVEIEMGSQHASGAADITVASVRSLGGGRLAKFDPARFKLVLVDEAHHIVAPGYMRCLAHFGLADRAASQRPGAPALVGVSATFSRFDGVALGAAIDEIVYHRDYVDMIGDGWLADVLFTTVASTADLSRVRTSSHGPLGGGGDFQTGDLSRAVNTPQVNDLTVRTWLAKAGGGARRSTLVFCVDTRHVADLARAFRARGVDAQAVTGTTDRAERSRRLDAFQRGAFPVLLNCGVFTEGTDLPSVDCVVLARPTKSRNLLVQMIGRGLRLHAGKADCHVLDMVSSLEAGIATTPTLFGLDPGELLAGASVADLRALQARRQHEHEHGDEHGGAAGARKQPPPPPAADGPPIRSVRFTEYESVFDLIADTSGERHIRGLSQHAWVQVGRDRYVLCGPTGTYLRIERAEDDGDAVDGDPFRIVEVRALPPGVAAKSPYAAPREVGRSATLAAAVRGADSYAAQIFPRAFVSRYQAWRKGPPTQGQLDLINKVRGPAARLAATDLTRGTAADMITKIKHGARGRFADLAASRRRQEKQVSTRERERAQRQREQVTVGPLAA